MAQSFGVWLTALLVALIYLALGSLILMVAWNYTLPKLFGWREINIWQALGLLVIFSLLFKPISVPVLWN